jgi:hypothetical protein
VTALDLPAICADSLEDVLRLCSVGGKTPSKNTSTVEAAAEIMPDTTQKRFKQLKNIAPPEEVAEQEILYIKKLMDVYREAEGIAEFSRDTLKQYDSKYGEHFKRQRKDFYAAESVRQGTRETYGETDPDQFEVLKEETYDGVIDVWEQYYSNGLVRLNTVLAQAAQIRIDRCWLCRDTDWIGNSQKKGVCHILANDDKIKRWVNTDE